MHVSVECLLASLGRPQGIAPTKTIAPQICSVGATFMVALASCTIGTHHGD
jgi:hypothetical protein